MPFEITVKVQDFPDRGRGSWEKPTGADLYISLVIHDDEQGDISKGMLVQSKWDHTFKPNAKDLREKCEKMLARSDSSYIWKFGPSNVESIRVEDVLNPPEKDFFIERASSVGTQIANGIRCTEGDIGIGRDLSKPAPQSLSDIMRELAVEKSMEISARKTHSFLPD